jgi:hypothetical protein
MCIPTVMYDVLDGDRRQNVVALAKWIMSTVKLSAFQLYQNHLSFLLNVSSVNWNALSVICSASTVNTTHFLEIREFGPVCCGLLTEFKGPSAIKGELKF